MIPKQTFYDNLRKYFGKIRLIILFSLIYLISQVIIISILSLVGVEKVVTLQTTIFRNVFINIIQLWSNKEISIYTSHFYFDFFHCLWYCIWLISVMATLFNSNKISDRYNCILILPILAALLDELENLLHIFMICNQESITETLVFISGTASIAKWIISALCVLIIISLILKKILWRDTKNETIKFPCP